MTRSLSMTAVLVLLAAGCSEPVSTIQVTTLDALMTVENIRLTTDTGDVDASRVRAGFLENANLATPFAVDSVFHNGKRLPLVSLDSGLYQLERPLLGPLVPGAAQVFRIVGGSRFPDVMDSVILPTFVDSLVVADTLSLSRGIPLAWRKGDGAELDIRIANSLAYLRAKAIHATPDDGRDTVPLARLADIAPGEAFLFVSKLQSRTNAAGSRHYGIFASSTRAIPVTLVP